MDELINDFLAETREMLQALSGEIVAWESDPSDRARLDEIFRFVHTVKGNCGFFDLPRLQQLSAAWGEQGAVIALEPEAATVATETKKGMRSIRLSVDLLDRMMSGVSD